MQKTIEIRNLTKKYKNGVMALENVSFTTGSGVFGLLGHNGAGKTTLMKILVTILQPSSGGIRVCDFDTMTQGDEVRKRIGYLPQELAMYPSLSVADFMNYMAALKGVHEKHAVAEVLEQVEMLEFSRRKIGQLSGGMKRRVGIAQALLGKPQILVVDEPTQDWIRKNGSASGACYPGMLPRGARFCFLLISWRMFIRSVMSWRFSAGDVCFMPESQRI